MATLSIDRAAVEHLARGITADATAFDGLHACSAAVASPPVDASGSVAGRTITVRLHVVAGHLGQQADRARVAVMTYGRNEAVLAGRVNARMHAVWR